MRIIALSTLKRYVEGRSGRDDARNALLAWYQHVRSADWARPSDVKSDFGNASILRDGRVVFNVAGNRHRLVVWINYQYRVVYIRFVGTHAEYADIDPQTICDASRDGEESSLMNIKPIRSARDHGAALREIEKLMSAKQGTAEGDRLDVLVTLVEAYERKRFPMDAPDPVAAIRLAMERKDLTPKDLVPMIGRLNRVHEILTGRRGLTLAMIRRLHDGLGIPAESLIRPSRRRSAA